MNAFRKVLKEKESVKGKIFLTSGLGGMSGAQPKAAKIVGCISITVEINPLAVKKRFNQGWVDVLISDINELVDFVKKAQINTKPISIAFPSIAVQQDRQRRQDCHHPATRRGRPELDARGAARGAGARAAALRSADGRRYLRRARIATRAVGEVGRSRRRARAARGLRNRRRPPRARASTHGAWRLW